VDNLIYPLRKHDMVCVRNTHTHTVKDPMIWLFSSVDISY